MPQRSFFRDGIEDSSDELDHIYWGFAVVAKGNQYEVIFVAVPLRPACLGITEYGGMFVRDENSGQQLVRASAVNAMPEENLVVEFLAEPKDDRRVIAGRKICYLIEVIPERLSEGLLPPVVQQVNVVATTVPSRKLSKRVNLQPHATPPYAPPPARLRNSS